MVNSFISSLNIPAQVILSLSLMLSAGFILTRITKLIKLPNVTGYILAGVLIGPSAFNFVPREIAENMGFITDISLAFIAFGIGRYFKTRTLRKNGKSIIIITLCEALTAAGIITFVMYLGFGLPLEFSLLLGAIGSATAPASTIMTVRQYHAKGDFVDTVLQIVALDDAVSLISFSLCAAVIQVVWIGEGLKIDSLILPLIFNILSVIAGGFLGFISGKLTGPNRSRDHRLIVISALVFFLTGLCSALGISSLLACMVMGAVFVNTKGNVKVFKQISGFTPAINTLFFVLSGMRLNISSLKHVGIIGITYFFVRIAGKYTGSWIGAKLTNTEPEIRKYLGLALVPQAGVSIGLAVLGQRILPYEVGNMLMTIILSSGIMYEIAGPLCAKKALHLSGSFKKPDDRKKTEP